MTAIVAVDRLIPSDTPAVELFVRNKRCANQPSAKPVVLVHGATFPSASLFDVRVGGFSFMDALANAGLDVWSMDARGYGGSTRPAEMDRPADATVPMTPAKVAVRDLATVVDHVLRERGVERAHVIGVSWGGSVAGAFVAANAGRVDRLALVAPLWLSAFPLRFDGGGPIPGLSRRRRARLRSDMARRGA